MSDFDLNPGMISLLSKGLNFCPTPFSSDLLELEGNLREFVRLLLLKDNFGHISNDSTPEYLVRRTGQTIPSESKDMLLNGVIFNIIKLSEKLDALPTNHAAAKSNITMEERQALKLLRDNNDIVIKQVDKGGGIVIMDTSYYEEKVNECLSNTTVYKKCNMKVVNTAMNKVISFVDKHKNLFDTKKFESKYIKLFDFKEASFYGLPKIHKSLTIQSKMKTTNNVYLKMTAPSDLPFRFITAGPNSPTSKLSEFLDILLKPYLEFIPSYIRDTPDFLNKLPHLSEEEIEDTEIITCDVKNMYQNIKQDVGLNAVRSTINDFPHLLHSRFNVDFVIEGLKIVLENSHFVFNNQCYNMICGTATGTTVAPTYANITMGFLERELYNKVFQKYGEKVYTYVKIYWKRFLDDGQILWQKSFGPITDFVEILNSLDSNIVFTHESSDTGLPFLNVFLYIEDKKILTDIYYKNTDSHDYLPFNSCHPRHIKINIPKTLARIICTIVKDPSRKLYRLSELKTWLLKAGYPCGLINNGFSQILQIDQTTLRTKVIHEKQNILPFVQTHNPRNPQVYSFLLSAFKFLLTSEKYSEVFKNTRLIKSERQPKNLGRMLQHSFFSRAKPKWGITRCGKSSCRTCPYLSEVDTLHLQGISRPFKIRAKFSCDARNLIYAIKCGSCGLHYIGSTGKLRGRLSSHKGDLKKAKKNMGGMKVHKHIAECASPLLATPFTITPFYKCKTKTFAQRVAIENYFRRKFKPPLNGY